MKNKWLILAGAVALTAFTTAQATPIGITGEVDMNGTVTLNVGDLASAVAATGFSGVNVGNLAGSATGSFAGTANDPVTWSGFTFSGGSAPSLWTYSDAGTGWTYKFQLLNDYVTLQNSVNLNLSGTGILSITGGSSNFAPTTGSWAFSINNSGGQTHPSFDFTFANSQTAVVPDGGATVMLLGAALSVLGLFRKKLIA